MKLCSKILELTGGEGPSLICESTGVPSIIEEACRVARAGGRIILYGLPSEGADIQFPVKTMIMKQLEVYGTLGSLLSWEHLIKLVDGGRINLKDMVTHTRPLDRIEEAFALVEDKTQDPIKVVLYPWA